MPILRIAVAYATRQTMQALQTGLAQRTLLIGSAAVICEKVMPFKERTKDQFQIYGLGSVRSDHFKGEDAAVNAAHPDANLKNRTLH